MTVTFRKADINDIEALKKLAIKSWKQYQSKLTDENWKRLQTNLTADKTYTELFEKSQPIVCSNGNGEIVGMAFFVPSGTPTEIYDKEWCSIRLLSVDPDFGGCGIGSKLTDICISKALANNESIIALHTSALMNAARHIYEKAGFTILKEIEPRLGVRYWLYTLYLAEKRTS